MELLRTFKAFAAQNDLLPGDAPTLLAVSGGLDSVVLTHLFHVAGWPCGVAHCNFQLRDLDADEDALFVETLASAYDLPFLVKRFDTADYAEQNGLSIQMAARELRYRWFESLRIEQGYGQVATAHHADDNLETVLLHFARGAGLAGLSGIPVRNGAIIRPLLFAFRAELETYAAAHALSWREDRSNATDDYARNFVRHNLVPLFQTLNPNFRATATRNIRRVRGAYANSTFLLRRFLSLPDREDQGFNIDKQRLAQLPDRTQALHALLDRYGFTAEQSRQLAENADRTGLLLSSPEGWQVLNDRERIVVSPRGQETPPEPVTIHADDLLVRLPDRRALVLTPATAAPPYPDGREAILVDAGKLQFPLLLRPWRPGDWFQPFGMQGQRQKLQDFLTNTKLSRLEKEQIWLLENGDGSIIWVLGHRLDERFKVSFDTEKTLKISVLEN